MSLISKLLAPPQGSSNAGADPVHMKMLVTMMAKVRLQLGRPVHHLNRIASLLASPCSGFQSRAGKVVDPLWLLQRELATHRRHDLPPCCKGALLKLTSADLAVRALACPGIQSDGVRLRPLALHTNQVASSIVPAALSMKLCSLGTRCDRTMDER